MQAPTAENGQGGFRHATSGWCCGVEELRCKTRLSRHIPASNSGSKAMTAALLPFHGALETLSASWTVDGGPLIVLLQQPLLSPPATLTTFEAYELFREALSAGLDGPGFNSR